MSRQTCPRCKGERVVAPRLTEPCSTCLGLGTISPSHWAYVHTIPATPQEQAA